jgi:hypothetical protein
MSAKLKRVSGFSIDDNHHSTAAIYFNRTGDIDVEYQLYGPRNPISVWIATISFAQENEGG